ncbi:MAG: DNA-binding protein [Nitrosopumilaceae archaeon]|nr:DNA-binding protein [Nitrosopumilaceae archaeon]NIU02641.1 DNA-binding protein [Nitrosopumilaceae archaeon]NIU89104.1 DNA-binding protein [Nitrosopumilaceae archaeon]NIV67207.1 DNA-binding protein [Nitrosopumilaceae archaeon]NIX63242.1 DNA-binding protein [Nitrosopumilaceae archaeon]
MEDIKTEVSEKKDDIYTYFVSNTPVMQTAVDVLSILAKNKVVKLRAKGFSIPNAVAVANIITEKMLPGNSKTEDITVDSEIGTQELGRMISTIEIILMKV